MVLGQHGNPTGGSVPLALSSERHPGGGPVYY